jgi:hypothetical protein
MPLYVEIWGIEIGNDQLHGEMTREVAQAVVELETTIFSELCEAPDARTVAGELTAATR